MKKMILLLTLLSSLSVMATSGLTCRGVNSSFELETDEALISGNNLISVHLTAPSLFSGTTQFDRSNSTLVVDRSVGVSESEVVYSVTSSAVSLTLLKDSTTYMGYTVSELILVKDNQIFKEYVSCSYE